MGQIILSQILEVEFIMALIMIFPEVDQVLNMGQEMLSPTQEMDLIMGRVMNFQKQEQEFKLGHLNIL